MTDKMKKILHVKYYYCGRGDTILIQSLNDDKGSGWGLIDCFLTKSSGAYYRIRKDIQDKDIKSLKFVCLTHPHRDHYHGMRELLTERFYNHAEKQMCVEEFWDSGVNFAILAAIDHRLGNEVKRQGLVDLYRFMLRHTLNNTKATTHRIQHQGSLSAVDFGDFYFLCLSPTADRVDRFTLQDVDDILMASYDDVLYQREQCNDLSLIVAIMHKELPISIILGGDATREV
jgi:hypothetical protein